MKEEEGKGCEGRRGEGRREEAREQGKTICYSFKL